MSDTKETAQKAIEALGLTIRAGFIPFSQSRNRDEKDDRGNPRPSLNWRVTLQRNGRDILTTDYSAGAGHCPSYRKKAPIGWNQPARNWQPLAAKWECEHGREATFSTWQAGNGFHAKSKTAPLMPDTLDVIYALVRDADVFDAGSFEEWASDLGYDADSRKAEIIYRACLDIALQMRRAIGDAGLEALRTAFQDY